MKVKSFVFALMLLGAFGALGQERNVPKNLPVLQIAGACEDQCFNTQKTCTAGCGSAANQKTCVDGCLRGSDACRKRCGGSGLLYPKGESLACAGTWSGTLGAP
jgi:hypothetical protein